MKGTPPTLVHNEKFNTKVFEQRKGLFLGVVRFVAFQVVIERVSCIQGASGEGEEGCLALFVPCIWL